MKRNTLLWTKADINISSSVATALLATSTCMAGSNPVVWNNGPSAPGGGQGTVAAQLSQTPSPYSIQGVDDFQIAAGALITDVHWTGFYFNGTPVANPGPAFIIRIYGDNGTGTSPTGGPGDPSATALATFNTGAGGANQHAGTVANTLDYSYVLPTPFPAQPNTKYWLSLQAVVNFAPAWSWALSTTQQMNQVLHGGHGFINFTYWSVAVTSPISDASFTLTGTPLSAPCPANIVNSGTSANVVDVDDLLAVISGWGPCPAPPEACPANIVTTGTSAASVDVDDLLAVISSWGLCP